WFNCIKIREKCVNKIVINDEKVTQCEWLFILEVAILTALVDLILSGVIYCSKGMEVQVEKKPGKYAIVSRMDLSKDYPKEIKFKVSNELMPLYFV
ncbi:hypothetical protein D922_03565, partial [Enterococcus faecalis 06-MB-DW-09]